MRSVIGTASLVLAGCMLSEGIQVYHRIDRAAIALVDDDVFLFSEHGYVEECVDHCMDGSERNHAYRLYSMRASTGKRTLLASDSGKPIASVYIKPYLYLPSPAPDSVIRVRPETNTRDTVANGFGLFRNPYSQAYLSSRGKYAVIRACSDIACETSLYDAADRALSGHTSVTDYSMYLDDDSLVLYGLGGIPDTDRIKIYAYHVPSGTRDSATLPGKYQSGIPLDDGSQILLYRNASGIHMFPELANAKLKAHLDALAEMEWWAGLFLDPVSGAYVHADTDFLYYGNLYTGKRKKILATRESD